LNCVNTKLRSIWSKGYLQKSRRKDQEKVNNAIVVVGNFHIKRDAQPKEKYFTSVAR